MSDTMKLLNNSEINTTDKWIVFIKHYPVDVGFDMHGPFASLTEAIEYVETQDWTTESFIAEIHKRSKMELMKVFKHHDMVE